MANLSHFRSDPNCFERKENHLIKLSLKFKVMEDNNNCSISITTIEVKRFVRD